MNFISSLEGQEIHVELKYCERCGGLWLRPQGTGGVFCASCRVSLAALPDPGEAPPRKPRRRRKVNAQATETRGEDARSASRIEYLEGVAAMEVRA